MVLAWWWSCGYVPWLLTRVSRTGSRELFTMGVLALHGHCVRLCGACSGVSFALGRSSPRGDGQDDLTSGRRTFAATA